MAPWSVLLLAIACSASLPVHSDAAAPETALQKLLSRPALRGARVGIAVMDLESGEHVLMHSAHQLMVPASTQKLIVASAALARWGPAHRFSTPVRVQGELDSEGVLKGTLWIEGRGDPSLTSESLWKLAEEIRLHGVKRVQGGIGIDASYFDGRPFHPDWEPLSQRAYHAPTSAFAVNYSSFRIDVSPASEIGKPVRVTVAPFTSYLRVHADALTVAKGNRLEFALERLPDGTGERVRVQGSLALGAEPKTYWRRVDQPELYAATLLRAQLETQGVRVSGLARLGRVPPEADELFQFESEPLGPIVWKLNKFSNNFIAEQVTKLLGAEVHGAPGTWEKGTAVLRSHLRALGFDDRRAVVADGSGLSARNRLSAAMLTEVARQAALRFESGAEFVASLPLGGLDGTLEDRMNSTGPPVRGKTGHLRYVTSLSGFVPRGARRLVFSILVNGARGNQLDMDAAIDAFVAELADSPAERDQGTNLGESS